MKADVIINLKIKNNLLIIEVKNIEVNNPYLINMLDGVDYNEIFLIRPVSNLSCYVHEPSQGHAELGAEPRVVCRLIISLPKNVTKIFNP